LVGLSREQARTAAHDLPVVEDERRERLAAGRAAEVAVEAERLRDGKVSLDSEHRRADTLLLAEHLPTTLVEARVDAADRVLRALDLDCEEVSERQRRCTANKDGPRKTGS
jgi:hypothetical protein